MAALSANAAAVRADPDRNDAAPAEPVSPKHEVTP